MTDSPQAGLDSGRPTIRWRSRSPLLLLVALGLALGASPAAAGRPPNPPGDRGEAAGWSAPPAGVDARHWRPADAPAGTPAPRFERSTAATAEVTLGNCYPTGTAGYEARCREPGYLQAQNGGMHWGDEPYYGTGKRTVYVLDALAHKRTREWLAYWINTQNSNSGENGLNYLLYQAEWAGWTRGVCNLNGAYRQWIEVCPLQGSTTSTASLRWLVDGTNHLTSVTVKMGTLVPAAGEFRIQNSVYHEMGHAIGFAHDTNCVSVMTYCKTYLAKQYLNYATAQLSSAVTLYSYHTN